MTEIRINYDEMRAAAADFDQQAETAEQLVLTLSQRTDQLVSSWDGSAQRAFIEDMAACRNFLGRVPELLKQIAHTLRTTADNIETAEQASINELSKNTPLEGL